VKLTPIKQSSIIAVVVSGLGIIAVSQLIHYLLDSSPAASLWSLAVTTALTGALAVCILRLIHVGLPAKKNSSKGEAEHRQEERSEELVHSDRLNMAGTLAAGIAHEIRNPLTSLRGFLQLLQKREPQYTEIMLSEVDRINHIVTELLELASPKESRFEPRLLQPLLQNVITLLQPQALLHQIQLIGNYGQDTGYLVVVCSELKLKQVFINLIKNAMEAMPDGGNIVITLAAEGEWARVEIADDGNGIPQELIDKIGNPFFTTKAEGTGLGLMISRRIVEDHKGRLSFRNLPKGGAAVTVGLPTLHDTGGL
jgi:two-component system, sporulation sensor kinase C